MCNSPRQLYLRCPVAPFTGAWIEIISLTSYASTTLMSHPSRVRGLKLLEQGNTEYAGTVAPFTGAWIEI